MIATLQARGRLPTQSATERRSQEQKKPTSLCAPCEFLQKFLVKFVVSSNGVYPFTAMFLSFTLNIKVAKNVNSVLQQHEHHH